MEIHYYKTIDSTNLEAKRFCEKGSLHKVAFIASEQTAGRGRLSRVFHSPAGTGIYFSFVYSPDSGTLNPSKYTIAAAVAVCQAIEEKFGFENKSCLIKWVNDIFFNGRKISGILTEGIVGDETIKTVICGIGINVFSDGLPEEVKNVAGGIFEKKSENAIEIGKELAVLVCEKLEKFYDEMENSSLIPDFIIKQYRKRSILKGKTVTVNPVAGTVSENNPPYEAEVLDIDNKGNLVVLSGGKEVHLQSGEVSIGSGNLR